MTDGSSFDGPTEGRTMLGVKMLAGLALVLVGCASLQPPTEAPQPVQAPAAGPGAIVVLVENESSKPVTLVVSTISDPAMIVGVAEPSDVPPNTSREVSFTVPGGGGWMIYANGGGLLTEAEVGGRRGVVPNKIEVDASGQVSMTSR